MKSIFTFRQLKNLKFDIDQGFKTAMGILLALMLFNNTGWSQTPANCKLGCTSNDVQIKKAYLSDAGGTQLPATFVCPVSGQATVYLTLELTTNTPRVGVVIYANIKNFTPPSTIGSTLTTISQCFGIALNQPTNKVTFTQSFTWTCGTPIVLTDVFLGWGTGNTNFCTGTAFQCPGTSSKCYQLPSGQYIPIVTPSATPASSTLCSTQPGGTTAVFDLTSLNSTVSGGQSNVTVTWFTDANVTNQITNPSSYTSASGTVYAKVTSTISPYPYSTSAVTLTVKTTPAAPTLGKVDNCDGTSTITATGLASGATLTWSDGGSGNPRTVSSTTALTVTQTVNGCTSLASNSVTPAPKTTPAAPTLGKVDNCNGTSTITATGLVSGASLTWSDGGTGNPRTVSSTTALTVTQTVNGCTSLSSNSVTPAPKTTPAAPTLGKVDNCDGTSTITATGLVSGATLTWSDGGTGNPRTVNSTTALTVTQTVDGCTSLASNSVTPAPKTTPAAPSLGKVDNCNGTSTITATGVVSGATLTWSDAGSGNPRTVSSTTALTVTQTVNGCASLASNSVTPAPKTTPAAPTLGKVDNCNGTSTITATGLVSGATLTWSDGGTGNPRTVSSTTALTVTQTVNGCTSLASNSVTPAPKTTPASPTLGKVDNCDGTSTITASGLVSGATLTWSDGGTGNPRTVTSTTALTVTQTVNGCTSQASNSITPAPNTNPAAPAICVVQPSLCGPTTGSITVTSPTGNGFQYSIDNGTTWQSGATFSNLAPGSVTGIKVQNAGGCISIAVSCDASNCAPTQTVSSAQTQSIKIAGDQTTVKAYPNPFNNQVRFVVNAGHAGNGTLEIFNVLGQKVKTVYHGYVPAGVNNFDLNLPGQKNANLIYRFILDNKLVTGKLIQLNQ